MGVPQPPLPGGRLGWGAGRLHGHGGQAGWLRAAGRQEGAGITAAVVWDQRLKWSPSGPGTACRARTQPGMAATERPGPGLWQREEQGEPGRWRKRWESSSFQRRGRGSSAASPQQQARRKRPRRAPGGGRGGGRGGRSDVVAEPRPRWATAGRHRWAERLLLEEGGWEERRWWCV